MKNKKIIIGLAFSLLFVTFVSAQNLTLGNFLKQYFDRIGQDLPQSYQYIQLNYSNISQQSPLYSSLQKAVYMDMFPNSSINLPIQKEISEDFAARIIYRSLGSLPPAEKNQIVTQAWLDQTKSLIIKFSLIKKEQKNLQDEILQDVYQKLQSQYYFTEKVNKDKMAYGAIKGTVESLEDPYTKFLPPQEAKNLEDSLNAEYVGIGIRIDMSLPGQLVILATFKGTPAKKA
ncbi:MAG: hypothetical protein GXP45_00770 [bacterium]|nr:hypothetical protein [bacterium]